MVTKDNGNEMFMVTRPSDLAGEIAKSQLTHVDKELSVLAAGKLMRESGATELLVTGVTDGIFRAIGIVTANDIVTRVVATDSIPPS
jgi:CBS domain-containing protein